MSDRIDIPESDDDLLAECQVQTFRASGPGGQSVNTADSAVRLKHLPTGVVVVCRRERSQYLNKRDCLKRLRGKLEARNAEIDAPERVATKKPRAVKARQVADKRKRAAVKRTRGKVEPDEE
jgi:ribosome-associated protein